MIRVLFVHEARLLGDLMAAVLNDEPGIEMVGYAKSAAEALTQLRQSSCDIMLLSVNLPDHDVFRMVREIAQAYPTTKVVVTELIESKAVILRCLEEGAAGYVLQGESLMDLVSKIRSVHHGEFVLAPELVTMLIARISELKQAVTELNGYQTYDETVCTELTAREWEVLQLIERGYSNLEIANHLTVELGTVKNHVHNVFGKLGVRSRKHAALLARPMLATQKHASRQALSTKQTGLPLMTKVYQQAQSL
jgi:DNA-binding NarL/FixJ family response regulator